MDGIITNAKSIEILQKIRKAMIERHATELAECDAALASYYPPSLTGSHVWNSDGRCINCGVSYAFRAKDTPCPAIRKFDFPPMSEKKWSIAEVEDVLRAAVVWFESVRVNGLGSGQWTMAEHDLYRALLRMVGVPK